MEVQLDRIFSGPFARRGFVAAAVGLVDVCDFGYEWVVGVRVGEHGADGEEDFRDRQRWGPLITEDV